ncbi:MAG: gliding motility-associated C-terminal domain-containing protein [Bacteroidetes bacterium]|nr:gliding motility-associated C-terminal domain-containing protein [Bacteroidota bacterium]
MKPLLLFSLFFTSLFFCRAQVNLTNGLIAYYPFSGNANDASGNNINGTTNNVSLTTDRFGNANSAYYFDGSSSYIQLPFSSLYDFKPQDSLSISVWVLPDLNNPWPAQAIVVKSPPNPDFLQSNWNYGIYALSYKMMTGWASNNFLIGTTTMGTNQCWYNLTFTYKNGIWKIYVNGILENQDLTQTKFIIQDGPASKIALGKKGESSGDYYKGKMDEVRIYNRVLNQAEITALSQSPCGPMTCGNWLNTPSLNSAVNLGDLDVSGNQLTIEATINRTAPYTGGNLYAGDVVAKHQDPSNVNYLLRPNSAEITTSNGYFITPSICSIELNKTYHIAMVYDGSVLKFYRNGFLMSQVNATGNLFQNNFNTRIGYYDLALVNTQFIGYINEVRIWNVARTQAQIQAYMNTSLPSPTTQTGLLGYYTFDNLINKQGNAAFNGTLNGSATINATNPVCNFIADSCPVNTPVSNIINNYTPVLGFDQCKNIINVEDASAFNAGDTVLLIQMKGAVIDSSNSASFGTITNYKNAGNYEFNYVKSKSGNSIELLNNLTRGYDIPAGKVQLVRVPYLQDATISGTLTCAPWDGSKGGVLAFNVQNSITLNANIDVTGKGFSGGSGYNPQNSTLDCFENDYTYPVSQHHRASQKGESITTISQNILYGKGSPACGGGGGQGHNSGGGGGSNFGTGGFGGYQLEPCGNAPFDNRGIGGHALQLTTPLNRIFLGGGGGAGHSDNVGNLPSSGGTGGGIVIITANSIKANSFKIIADGNPGQACSIPPSSDCHDGMGGGGAGGSVLLNINSYQDNITIQNKGGAGANMIGSVPLGGRIGAGGGGGGGLLFINAPTLPSSVTNINTGGINGVLTTDNNNPWGTTPGQQGGTLFNLQLPVDQTPFKTNIDSVRFNFSTNACSSVNFNGLAYINSAAIATWQWYFGDGGTATTQNTTHSYVATGTFQVKLVVTDINGCKDSVIKPVTITAVAAFDFSYKQDVCNPLTVQFTGAGTPLTSPYWNFGDATVLTGNISPSHTYAAPGNYLVRYSVVTPGCNDTISKTISINYAQADIIFTPDTTICYGASKQLRAQPSVDFCWSPTTYLNNPNSYNPITTTPTNITYYYNALITGNNLITNGSFDAGNTGFTSQYNYAVNNTTEGEYFVGPSPSAWNASLSSCTDHTGASGNGNMMLVNGAPNANVGVWAQTVNVTPNTNYVFSAWIQALYPPNPAQLRFAINGVNIGTPINASLPTCTWTQFYTTWNSGAATTADISIVNQNIIVLGNDFALDDIVFAPVTIRRDSVTITVDTPAVQATGTATVCAGTPAQLNATGTSTYVWTPATGLSNSGIANPVATPASTTTYTVTGTTIHGCTAQSAVTVTVLPVPVITKSNDTSICKATSVQLFAGGGTSYIWSPAATLSNPNIANPVATPLTSPSKYYVTVINTAVNSCSSNDSVTVSFRPDPVFTVSAPQTTCQGTSPVLKASGGDQYLWTPAALVTDPFNANTFATANTTTTYSVTIIESVCHNTATLSTVVTVNPTPVVTASRSNDIDCSIEFANLSASGATQYTWSPAGSLNNSAIANPVARPTVTTQYIVQGFNSFGCSSSDSVVVAVTKLGESVYPVPNTFTPNGDGKNDCFGIKYWGIVDQIDFMIYNRYGERVFYTNVPYQCWDGTYKGAPADPGNYVYYIKAKTACGMVEKKGNIILAR